VADNATAHAAKDYGREVALTIPFHATMLGEAIDAGLAAVATPRRWLDTGAGPGELVRQARARSPETLFFVADPAPAMLSLAREANPDLPEERFVLAPSSQLPALEPFDVITAVQCHHYGDAAERERSVRRCFELLSPSGALVVFENVLAETDRGHAMQRARWAAWQRRAGRDAKTVEDHLAREGKKFFPVRVSEHLSLLRATGFAGVEVVWRAYGQAGFVAWK
jgi:tRNA (cmo5U34)-methyltransferase